MVEKTNYDASVTKPPNSILQLEAYIFMWQL